MESWGYESTTKHHGVQTLAVDSGMAIIGRHDQLGNDGGSSTGESEAANRIAPTYGVQKGPQGGSSPERLQRVPERAWSKSRALKHWGTGAMCPSTVTAAGRVDKCHVVQLIGSCS